MSGAPTEAAGDDTRRQEVTDQVRSRRAAPIHVTRGAQDETCCCRAVSPGAACGNPGRSKNGWAAIRSVARIEPEHDLSERDEIPAAFALRPEARTSRPLASSTASRAGRSISSNRPSRRSSGLTSQLPPTARTEGSARCSRAPSPSTAVALAEDGVDVREALDVLRDRGHGLTLSESGPHVFGSMLAAGLVDELFLTLSPALAGRRPSKRPPSTRGVCRPHAGRRREGTGAKRPSRGRAPLSSVHARIDIAAVSPTPAAHAAERRPFARAVGKP